MSQIILANLCLLALAVCLLLLIRYHARDLEHKADQSQRTLAVRDSRLQTLTYALGDQIRSAISVIEDNARLLLQKYGGFLPPVGYECAEQVLEAAAEMERLRKDLLGFGDSDTHKKAA